MIRILVLVVLLMFFPNEAQSSELIPKPHQVIPDTKSIPLDLKLAIPYKFEEVKAYPILSPRRSESIKYRIISKIFKRVVQSQSRRYVKQDFEQFYLNSLHPWRALREYEDNYTYAGINIYPSTWNSETTLYNFRIAELSEDLRLRKTFDLRGIGSTDIFSWGILRTKCRFKLKLGGKELLRSFSFRAEKRFTFLRFLGTLRVKYRYRVRTRESLVTFNILLVGA